MYSGIRRIPCTTRVSTAAFEILRILLSSQAVGSLTGVCASLLPSCTEKIDAPSVFHLQFRGNACTHLPFRLWRQVVSDSPLGAPRPSEADFGGSETSPRLSGGHLGDCRSQTLSQHAGHGDVGSRRSELGRVPRKYLAGRYIEIRPADRVIIQCIDRRCASATSTGQIRRNAEMDRFVEPREKRTSEAGLELITVTGISWKPA